MIQCVRFAAVDQDCDGASTSFWNVYIDASIQPKEAHKAAYERLTQSYFGFSDTFLITYDEQELMAPGLVFSDAHEDNVGVWHASVNGDAFRILREQR